MRTDAYRNKRELIFLTNDPAEQHEFGKAVYQTPVGQRFLAEFELTNENLDIVQAATAKLFPGLPVTESRFVTALRLSMDACDLTRKPAAPVVASSPEPEVLRDRNGRPLTTAQVKWGEYQRFLAESSSEQVAERRRTDPGFRAFIQHNIKEEMSQPIDGAVVAQGDIRPNAPRVDDKELTRLQKFAEDFNVPPCRSSPERRCWLGINPQWESITKAFEKCRALRLL